MTLLDDIAADLPTYFDATEGFAVVASFIHSPDPAASINVIFDTEYYGAELSRGVAVETSELVANCISSDVSTAIHGDTLTIDSVVYTVTGVEPDLNGGTTKLRLRV